MTLSYKNLSDQAIQKKCRIFKIEPSQYHEYIRRLKSLHFNLDHCHLILFKTGFEQNIQNLEINLEQMTNYWGFSHHQIAKMVGFGSIGVLNAVIYHATPLLSYGYSRENIVKIAIHANAREKFKYLIENHSFLHGIGLNVKDISTLLLNHQTIESINHMISTQYGLFRPAPIQEPQRSPTRQELSRIADTPSPYSHAVYDDNSDRPTPYSHALDSDISDRPSPYSHEVPLYPDEMRSPSRLNFFDSSQDSISCFGYEPFNNLENFSSFWEQESLFKA